MNAIDILKGLIPLNTVNPPGNERTAALWLKGLLESGGVPCTIQELGDNRANLIAELEGAPGPELMLNGHLDVVPAAGDWASDPFAVREEGCRLYGRGSADMKGGLAAMCAAAIQAAQSGTVKKGRLRLLFVADEECFNLGTLSYLKQYRPADYAVIGEPTGLKIAVAHRGASRDYIDIPGTSRHAALPETSPSAISKVPAAIAAVERMNRELSLRVHEVLPPPSIAVTMLQAYEKDNIVPGNVRMLLDFRILPGMTHEEVSRILTEGFERAGLSGISQTPYFYMPGGSISLREPFVGLCLEEREKLLGEASRPCAFDASCEQCFFTQHGIKTVICGPGSITQAHTTDEFTDCAQVLRASELYGALIRRVLG